MDESQWHRAKWKQPGTKGDTPCDTICMAFWKSQNHRGRKQVSSPKPGAGKNRKGLTTTKGQEGPSQGEVVIVTQLYTFVKMHRTASQSRPNLTMCKLLLNKQDISSSLCVARLIIWTLFSEQSRKGHEKLRQLGHWFPGNTPSCLRSEDAEVSAGSYGVLIPRHCLRGKAFTIIHPKHWATILSFPTGQRNCKYECDLN